MMFPLLNVFDAVSLLLVLGCSFEIVRVTHRWHSMMLSLSNAFICIGAMGWIIWDATGVIQWARHDLEPNQAEWWMIVFHVGIAMYSVRLYRMRVMVKRYEEHSVRTDFRPARPHR